MYKLVQLLAHKVCVYERLCSMATTVDLGNVIGPQGPQGPQGIQGPKGDTGPAGANWYVLALESVSGDYGKLVPLYGTDVIEAFDHYPYIECVVEYRSLVGVFVPTAYYGLWDESINDSKYYIQFSCLTLKDTANDSPLLMDYYNCVVICNDGTVTGSVRDVDPAVDWANVQNKPFNDVDSSILYINSQHTLRINMDIICPNYTLGNAATCNMDYSLAIGSDSIAGGEYDIAIGTGAHTIPDNPDTKRHCNIAIGNAAVCDASTNCIAIGTNAIASGEASICIGQNANVANAIHGISLGNNAICGYENSVALGAQSQVDESNQVSIGNSDIQRRLSNVANPTKLYDAVNMDYFKKNIPVTVKITHSIDPSKANLNTSKTYAQFPSISINTEVYNALFKYMYKLKLVPDSIIFEYINYGDDSITRQVFPVSDSSQMYLYLEDKFNFTVYAQSFVHQQMTTMIESESSTMLNLARVSLQLDFAPLPDSGPRISISVTSSSAIQFDSGRTYGVYLSFKSPVQ